MPANNNNFYIDEYLTQEHEQAIYGKYKIVPYESNRASQLGYECLRYLTLKRLHWQEEIPPSIATRKRFARSIYMEDRICDEVKKAGHKIIEQQVAFSMPKYNITGHIDGKISLYEVDPFVPVEIKEVSEEFMTQIKRHIKGVKDNKYFKNYIIQINLYMLMSNCETGIMIIRNDSGDLIYIRFNLDYELAEKTIKKAEAIETHLKNNTLPDYLNDPEQCQQCSLKHVCCPPLTYRGVPVDLINAEQDESLIIKIDNDVVRLRQLSDWIGGFTKEKEKINKEIKALVKKYDHPFHTWNHELSINSIDKAGYEVKPRQEDHLKIKDKVPND
ncbi:MAG: hypothetical protein M0P71_07505 [Melioribacteraceae bacterium]|jgi:CRISPR/Cas system-associated exonuclease Cas4 (RecB family)|nr:hypothetical protein [Melioribacteraceae bacterium]MDD3982800.1 hypothetical protein [Candidatus Omnitrophota bacterium]